jgi:hypothetical protein
VWAFFSFVMGALAVAFPFINPTPNEQDLRPISGVAEKYWFHEGSGYDYSTETLIELQNGVEIGTHALGAYRVSELLGGPSETTLASRVDVRTMRDPRPHRDGGHSYYGLWISGREIQSAADALAQERRDDAWLVTMGVGLCLLGGYFFRTAAFSRTKTESSSSSSSLS